jgi:uncharacterized membrane protein
MRGRIAALGLLAFLGMIDTLYLGLKRGKGPIPCTITSGCEQVLTSEYSEFAGIPISWFGFAFYLTVFSCAVFAGFGAERLLRWILWLAIPAFLISAVLAGIQVFIIESYCEYCLGSAALVTAILLASAWPRRQPAS